MASLTYQSDLRTFTPARFPQRHRTARARGAAAITCKSHVDIISPTRFAACRPGTITRSIPRRGEGSCTKVEQEGELLARIVTSRPA